MYIVFSLPAFRNLCLWLLLLLLLPLATLPTTTPPATTGLFCLSFVNSQSVSPTSIPTDRYHTILHTTASSCCFVSSSYSHTVFGGVKSKSTDHTAKQLCIHKPAFRIRKDTADT
ncbi:hypothetical protein F5Y13DRAFT_161116 [Hypoxylon sp. FL1857]|nr:hypothetical protein F5Y13DRAFT_161116 [Hypoxylon sp. FL1857]